MTGVIEIFLFSLILASNGSSQPMCTNIIHSFICKKNRSENNFIANIVRSILPKAV